jgi:hypothetical protein
MTDDEQFENNQFDEGGPSEPSRSDVPQDYEYPADFQQGAFGSGINIRVNQKKRRTGLIIGISVFGGLLLTLGLFFGSLAVAKQFMNVDIDAGKSGFTLSVTPRGAKAPAEEKTGESKPEPAE